MKNDSCREARNSLGCRDPGPEFLQTRIRIQKPYANFSLAQNTMNISNSPSVFNIE